jgi:hypothetical protein
LSSFFFGDKASAAGPSGGSSGGSLGSLSAKYESGGRGAGVIGNNAGDWGGKSYGTYQIASNTGTMNSFMSYLKNYDRTMYNSLSKHKVGSSGFDNAWKSLANNNKFGLAQHAFIKSSHYDPANNKVKSGLGIDINKRSKAVQDVLWSTAVQHGSQGAYNVFKGAGIKSNMSDREIIQRVYAERSANNGTKYFSKSSSSVRNSVLNRFRNEMQDALSMLR